MGQMKEQSKTSDKEANKMETSNLPDAEFKTLVIKMLSELRGKSEELSETFNKEIGNIKMEIENIKENQSEIKITKTEMNNTL